MKRFYQLVFRNLIVIPFLGMAFISLYFTRLFLPTDLSPKSDAERSWGLAATENYSRSGFSLGFAGDDDDDYLMLDCFHGAPSKVFVTVFRFRDAPYGKATIERNGISRDLDSVSPADWSRYRKNPSYHQFEANLVDIADLLGEPGILRFQLNFPDGSMQRAFPTKGICGERFYELCKKVWLDPMITSNGTSYLNRCIPT